MELNYTGSGNIGYRNHKYRFDLYKNDHYGSIMIEISVNDALCSFIELPFEFDLISGEYDNGFRFTLINCKRAGMRGLISEGRTVFSYYSRYMIKGIKYDKKVDIVFSSIHYSLSNIIEWGEISGYKVGDNFDITLNKNTTKTIYSSTDGLTVKYGVNYSMIPCTSFDLLRSEIKLNQTGVISVESRDASKDLDFFTDTINKIRHLVELCTLQRVQVSEIVAFSDEYYDEYNENRSPRPITIVCPKEEVNEETNKAFYKYKWITLTELMQYNSFEAFFNKYDLLKPIIESHIEIIYSQRISPVRAFLNIVQALETYHSRFITNDLVEFKIRIDILLHDCPEENKANYRMYLLANSKRFITLESRIADLLLAEFKTIFEIGDITRVDFPNVIAQTRNYYTHYDERIKEKARVLTPEELSLYNNTLLTILEYYILTELGFDDINLIREKLKERWGDISTALSIKKAAEDKHR